MSNRVLPWVRIRRWCRREPVQAVLSVALVLSIVAGAAGTLSNWREAVRQKREADRLRVLLVASQRQTMLEREKKEAHRAKADAINRFLIDKLQAQKSPDQKR